METKLGRIADKSAHEARPIFTSLYHLLNEEMLLACHRELSGNKAVGADEVTKEGYSRNLEENIRSLVIRIKNKSYKPQPVKRVYMNIYMHHVLILWHDLYYRKRGRGESFLVVFADDFITGFEYKSEAERYYRELKERLAKFGLEMEMSKSRLLEFGRYAKERRRRRGEGKPETFNFLGFTFYCGETSKGKYCVIPRTNSKRFSKRLKGMNKWLRENRNQPLKVLMKKLNQKLVGHYRYYGVTYNVKMLIKYHYYVVNMLFKWLNRRSQKKSFTWEQFHMMIKDYPIAKPRGYVNLYYG